MEDPIDLLREWFDFWASSELMPAKMPNSLHTRTVVALVTSKYEVSDLLEVVPKEEGSM